MAPQCPEDGFVRMPGHEFEAARRAPTTESRTGAWVRSLLARKATRLVTVAIANKTARAASALLVKGESYRAAPAI